MKKIIELLMCIFVLKEKIGGTMKFRILILFLVAIMLSGCRYGRGVRGNGHITEKEFNVPEFDRIDLGGIYSVDISIGGTQSIVVKAEENLMKYLVVKVRNHRLILDTKRNISPRKGIKVVIVTKALHGIQASGASYVEATDIKTDVLNLGISGASKIEISGKANELSLDVSGAGNLYAKKFICQNITADISGAAHAIVNATDKLYADISGAASLSYYGEPKNINYDISGAGSIKKR